MASLFDIMKQRVDDVVGKVIDLTASAVEDTEESNTAEDAEGPTEKGSQGDPVSLLLADNISCFSCH